MKAAEARKLTDKNLKGPVIHPALEHVHRLIEQAAKDGKDEIIDPLSGRVPFNWHTTGFTEALWAALRQEGYTVKEHPNPDPGDPRSKAYTSVSW